MRLGAERGRGRGQSLFLKRLSILFVVVFFFNSKNKRVETILGL